MTDDDVEAFVSEILAWGESNRRDFPWRRTEDPYEILVAEVLLQKTAAEVVEPVYRELIENYPNPEALGNADTDEVAEIVYSLGFQNQRSAALIEIGRRLVGSGVPEDRDELETLPYVGRYASNAVRCFAYGEPLPIVDANVVRVYDRYFGATLDYREDSTWAFADRILPEERASEFNLGLLDFAAEICAPKIPHCDRCPLSDRCRFFRSDD